MIRLLASVINKEEAMLALQGGANIIDLKDPARGALGALPLPVIHEVVHAVKSAALTSATIGDLPMEPGLLAKAVEATAATGVDIIKIGFFDSGDDYDAVLQAIKPLAMQGLKLIAVLFADHNPDFTLLTKLQAAGFYGVMLDTASKNGRSLLQYRSIADLHSFVELARACSLHSGLAGSLRVTEVPALASLQPDYLGFRGALCIGSKRTNMLSEYKFRELHGVLHKNNTSASDYLKTQAA
jgi:uncharacterized protein (UPF0264 family)